MYDDLDIEDFFNELESEINSVEELEKYFITSWRASDDEYFHRWNAYMCLNAEVDMGKKKYFLSNSKWYEIDSDFVEMVNKEFDEIEQVDLKLPDYNHTKEGDYNIAASTHLKALCLDAKNLPYGGGHSKIEFCDILTKDKKIIHVKKYGGSAVLSHLFSQGFVSAELLLTDSAFRQKVIDSLLTVEYKKVVTKERPKASEYKIYYGIITKQKRAKLSIPFFSKVVLKNNKRILEAYGYKLYLTKIKNVKVDDTEIEEEE